MTGFAPFFVTARFARRHRPCSGDGQQISERGLELPGYGPAPGRPPNKLAPKASICWERWRPSELTATRLTRELRGERA